MDHPFPKAAHRVVAQNILHYINLKLRLWKRFRRLVVPLPVDVFAMAHRIADPTPFMLLGGGSASTNAAVTSSNTPGSSAPNVGPDDGNLIPLTSGDGPRSHFAQPPAASAGAAVPLHVKALTLSYALPDADAEIRRLSEMQRNLTQHLNTVTKRPIRPDHVVLRDWLDQHPDATLEAAGLAPGIDNFNVASIRVDTSDAGMAALERYVIRGDLQDWLEKVKRLDEEVAADPGTWGAAEVDDVDQAMKETLMKALTKDQERRRVLVSQMVAQLCDWLSFVSERDMHVDVEFVTDEVEQLKRLSECVGAWHEHVKEHGHPRAELESMVKQRFEEETRRRAAEQGIRTAARSQGILLTDPQLDQVLMAFYEQRQPAGRHLQEKSKFEAKVIQTLKREEATRRLVTERCQRLVERNADLEATVTELMAKIYEFEHCPGERERQVQSLDQLNATTRVVAEVLARTKLNQAQIAVKHMSQVVEDVRRQHDVAQRQVEQLKTVNGDLRVAVDRFQVEWTAFTQLKAKEDEERVQQQGGQKSDILHLMSVITEVVAATCATMTRIIAVCRNAPSARSLKTACTGWLDRMAEVGRIGEGAKTVIRTLRQETDAWDAATPDDPVEPSSCVVKSSPASGSVPTQAWLSSSAYNKEKELVDDIVRRLDHAASELSANHCATRLMKRTIEYTVRCIDALVSGTYDDVTVGLRPPVAATVAPGGAGTDVLLRKSDAGATEAMAAATTTVPVTSFPPRAVTAPDDGYAFTWVEEFKMLERCFAQLRVVLTDTRRGGAAPSTATQNAAGRKGHHRSPSRSRGAGASGSSREGTTNALDDALASALDATVAAAAHPADARTSPRLRGRRGTVTDIVGGGVASPAATHSASTASGKKMHGVSSSAPTGHRQRPKFLAPLRGAPPVDLLASAAAAAGVSTSPTVSDPPVAAQVVASAAEEPTPPVVLLAPPAAITRPVATVHVIEDRRTWLWNQQSTLDQRVRQRQHDHGGTRERLQQLRDNFDAKQRLSGEGSSAVSTRSAGATAEPSRATGEGAAGGSGANKKKWRSGQQQDDKFQQL